MTFLDPMHIFVIHMCNVTNRCWRAQWGQERLTARRTTIHVSVRASGPTPPSAFTPTWARCGWVSTCLSLFLCHKLTDFIHTPRYSTHKPLPSYTSPSQRDQGGEYINSQNSNVISDIIQQRLQQLSKQKEPKYKVQNRPPPPVATFTCVLILEMNDPISKSATEQTLGCTPESKHRSAWTEENICDVRTCLFVPWYTLPANVKERPISCEEMKRHYSNQWHVFWCGIQTTCNSQHVPTVQYSKHSHLGT